MWPEVSPEFGIRSARVGAAIRSLAVLLVSGCFSPSGTGEGSETSASSATATTSGGTTTAESSAGPGATSSATTAETSTGTPTPTTTAATTLVTDATATTLATTDATMGAAMCGNGVVEPGEVCDDGNDVDDDGCTSACTAEFLYAFVSSEVYAGSAIGGVGGGHKLCTNLAGGVNSKVQGRAFVAWLSAPGTDAITALMHASELPYYNTAGQKVVDDGARFASGELQAPIDHDEFGAPANGVQGVWTGTLASGLHQPGHDCGGWSNAQMVGMVGQLTSTTPSWTDNPSQPCGTALRIYCIEVPPP